MLIFFICLKVFQNYNVAYAIMCFIKNNIVKMIIQLFFIYLCATEVLYHNSSTAKVPPIKRRIGNHVKIVSCRATVIAAHVSIYYPLSCKDGKGNRKGESQDTCLRLD